MISEPIHTGMVGGSPVRFFRPPTTDGELPWLSFVDLLVACRLPIDLREAYFYSVWGQPGAEALKVATPNGPAVTISNTVALAILGVVTSQGQCRADIAELYEKEIIAAQGAGRLGGEGA